MISNKYFDYFRPFPIITTKHLILRASKMSDCKDMYHYLCLDETSVYSEWYPHSSIFETRNFIKWLIRGYKAGYSTTWSIVLKDSGKVVGTCSYSNIDVNYKTMEFGYTVSPEYWGQGIGTEAASALQKFAFEKIKVCRLQARVIEGNIRSEALLKKLGFAFEGKLLNGLYSKGAPVNINLYAMTDADYVNIYNKY